MKSFGHKLQITRACALSSHNELLKFNSNHVPNIGLESWLFLFNLNFCDTKNLAKFSKF
jgi:hypothetical protein